MATFSDTGVRSHSKRLIPPIPNINPCKAVDSKTPVSDLVLPAIIFYKDPVVKPNENPGIYLDLDLKTPKLNDIHKRLWLAGLPRAARPLHRQKLLGRNILVTEDPDEHLVWFESQIFIKPLPIYLLHHDYWLEHVCSDQSLHQSACGLLLSYAWLVCYNSDLEIAKEAGLLPKCIEWTSWVKFIQMFLDNVNLTSLDGVNKRYIYGELRLSRLNAIYRFLPPSYSFKMLVRGYRAGSTWYNAFFERHFKWMLAVFAALSVLLSAFQVGLATSSLQGNLPFQNASYGFTVGSLLAVVAAVGVVVFVWLGLFCYHFFSTWQNDRIVDCKRRASLRLT